MRPYRDQSPSPFSGRGFSDLSRWLVLPPKGGCLVKRLPPYGERVARYTTPWDSFVRDLSSFIDGAWFVWIALAAAIAIVVVTVVITKARAKARSRIPQYRRQADS